MGEYLGEVDKNLRKERIAHSFMIHGSMLTVEAAQVM